MICIAHLNLLTIIKLEKKFYVVGVKQFEILVQLNKSKTNFISC